MPEAVSDLDAARAHPAPPLLLTQAHQVHQPPHLGEATGPGSDGLVVEEVLVEEISIDGMCGVY